MERKLIRRFHWTVLAVLAAVQGAPAQEGTAVTEAPPNYISYQGTLYHASDPDVPYDGALTIEFRLYRLETDVLEDAVWAERHLGIQIFSGIFNVYLGAGEAIEGTDHTLLQEVFKSSPLWLGVKAGLDDEIRPRQRINSIPYAMAAATAGTAAHGVPAGTIMMFAGATAPEGWVICDGTAYSKESYTALYKAVGSTWGETATTFNVPDLRARVPIGSGVGINANTDSRSGEIAKLHLRPFASTAGTETHALTVPQIPPHRHAYQDKSGSGSTAIVAFWYGAADENNFNDDPFATGATGGGTAHNNLQPVTYMHYIIKQ